MAREQPINAKVEPAKPGAKAPPPRQGRRKRRRKDVPGALKAVAALFLLAIVFLAAAILGGGASEERAAESPAPVSEAPSTSAETPAEQAPEQLGYPAFATSNTTRVGGADAVANAAGVSLATYPSTAPAQRPPAVTVVDAADWPAAIAASVLMAEPLGAPLLISSADQMPEPSSQALEALDPEGAKTSAGTQVFAIGAAQVPGDFETQRVNGRGADAAAAIAALRDRLLGDRPKHVVVAPAAEPAFAMPAAAWAARSGDPVLFTERDSLPKATAATLRKHPQVPVYVLGPSSAISSEVVRKIAAIAKRVRRVSGEDPVLNAIELARYASGGFGWDVNDPGHGFVVARSEDPLDAAAAAPLSASGTWGPLLLTDSAATLPAALRGYLLDVKPGYTTDPTRAFYNHVWVIGDQEAIEVEQQAEIDELAELARIGGTP